MSLFQTSRHIAWTWAWALGFSLLAAATAPCGDPPAVEWERTYGTDKEDCMGGEGGLPDSVQQTLDGGYIVAGKAGGTGYLLKVDENGNVEWEKTYGGTSPFKAVLQDRDGGYVVTYAIYNASTDSTTAFLMRTDGSGNRLCSVSLGATTDVRSMQATPDGGYILGGAIWPKADALLIKADSTGKKSWSRTYGGEDIDIFYSVDQTSDGGYALAGHTGTSFEGDPRFPHRAHLVKTDSEGHEEWFKTYGREDDFLWPVARQTSDGGYILVAGGWAFWLFKMDHEGNEEWWKCFGGSWQWPLSVRQTCDGGYITVGVSFSPHPQGSAHLIKTDAAGNQEWSWTSAGGTAQMFGATVQQTRDGGYIVAEASYVSKERDFDIFLYKLEPDSDCRPPSGLFRRGDTDSDGSVQLTDAVVTLDHLFRSGPAPGCLDAADADDNGTLEITDAIFTLSHLFRSGPALPEPSAACGADGTADHLGCVKFAACP